MKKLLFGAAIIGSLVSFTGSQSVASNEVVMSCASTLDEVDAMGFTNEETPVGLFSTNKMDITFGVQIYANSKDELGMFRSYGNFANHSTVSLCKLNGKTYLFTDDNEFFEYYLEDDHLFLAEDEYDEDFPETEEFEDLSPAEITSY